MGEEYSKLLANGLSAALDKINPEIDIGIYKPTFRANLKHVEINNITICSVTDVPTIFSLFISDEVEPGFNQTTALFSDATIEPGQMITYDSVVNLSVNGLIGTASTVVAQLSFTISGKEVTR